jgi:hypothetical protein
MKKLIFGIALIAGIVVLAIFERLAFATLLGVMLFIAYANDRDL